VLTVVPRLSVASHVVVDVQRTSTTLNGELDADRPAEVAERL
jgi:hypothetical protein